MRQPSNSNMDKPMNTESRIQQIFNAVASHHDFDEAISAVGELKETPAEIFQVLWKKAIQPSHENKHATIAALALYKLNIPCPLPPDEAIRQMCLTWDISLEEVPWYLVNQFSKEKMNAEIAKPAFPTEAQQARLETIRYWIGKMT